MPKLHFQDMQSLVYRDGSVRPAGTAPDLKHWHVFITLPNSSLCLGWSDVSGWSQKTGNIYEAAICLEGEPSRFHSRKEPALIWHTYYNVAEITGSCKSFISKVLSGKERREGEINVRGFSLADEQRRPKLKEQHGDDSIIHPGIPLLSSCHKD